MKKKVGIIVGHKKSSPGAVNYLGESEYDFNMRVGIKAANKILENGIEAILYHREKYESIGYLGEEIAEDNPDLTIELHFNGFHQPITGKVCEVLINSNHRRYQSGILAKFFNEAMENVFNFGVRGILKVNRGDRGHINLESIHKCNSRIASILVEPVFGNFDTPEAAIFFSSEAEYSQLLSDVVLRWYASQYDCH